MSRLEIIRLAKDYGWKQWGGIRPSRNGSLYQCYRRGNKYLWIGNCYVERSDRWWAVDYLRELEDVQAFIRG